MMDKRTIHDYYYYRTFILHTYTHGKTMQRLLNLILYFYIHDGYIALLFLS